MSASTAGSGWAKANAVAAISERVDNVRTRNIFDPPLNFSLQNQHILALNQDDAFRQCIGQFLLQGVEVIIGRACSGGVYGKVGMPVDSDCLSWLAQLAGPSADNARPVNGL